ncbi:MAG: GNAT family N-acetyltransferase [Halobacteria archaeon]|nr:GNAT family N-acetyltransferase [Halobacteria archaeon]
MEPRQEAKADTNSDVGKVETEDGLLSIDSRLLEIEEQIISLFHENIGPDYFDIPTLHRYVEKDNYNVYIYTLPDEKVHSLSDSSTIPENPEVVGVMSAGTCTKEDLEYTLKELQFSVDTLLDETPLEDSHFPISIVKTLVVDPEYQDDGIGFHLVNSVAAMLRNNPPAITTIWAKENDNTHGKVETIAKKVGGDRIAAYDRMWPEGWRCVECGVENECKCGCVVYALGL